MFDGQQLGAQLVTVVREAIDRAKAPLEAKIEALEARVEGLNKALDVATTLVGPAFDAVKKDAARLACADPEVLSALRRMVEEAIEKAPTPDFTAWRAEIDARIEAGLVKAAEVFPKPERGEKGEKGEDATVDPDLLRGLVEEALPAAVDRARAALDEDLRRAVAALPAAPAGRDADPALVRELVALEVSKIPHPKDGRDAVIELAAAGLTFDLDQDGRTIVVGVPQPDGTTAEHRLRTSIPGDAGVYRRDATYVKGDGVTHEGGYWLALRDDPGPIAGEGWRCAVRRGRPGDKGDRGDRGRRGDDGEVIVPLGRLPT